MHNPDLVAELLLGLHRWHATEQVARLLARDPAAHAPGTSTKLMETLDEMGEHEQALRAAANIVCGYRSLCWRLAALEAIGATGRASVLTARVLAETDLDDPFILGDFIGHVDESQPEVLAILLERASAGNVAVDNVCQVTDLIVTLMRVGAHTQAAALARRLVERMPLDDPFQVKIVLERLHEDGDQENIRRLLDRDSAGHVTIRRIDVLGGLLQTLVAVGAEDQARRLLARDPAGQGLLTDPPWESSWLFNALHQLGASDDIAVLADRVAAMPIPHTEHSIAYTEGGIAKLFACMSAVGAHEQAITILTRLPEAGVFAMFARLVDDPEIFRYGLDHDGEPAPPWGWDDLTI